MDKSSRILVLGHRGLVGGAIHLKLAQMGYAPRTGARVQTLSQALGNIDDAEYVFMAGGIGGGIAKNLAQPADLALGTMRMLSAVLAGAWERGVKRFIWFACACIYPRSPRASPESDLWAGWLEPTSRAFAAATLAGIELTRAYNQQYGTEFLAVCPPTVYGCGDDFSEDGHVLAAMIRKCHEAKVAGAREVTFWGSGRQRRQFLYADDLAGVAVEIMASSAFASWAPLLNVAGEPARPLAEVAHVVAGVVGYPGQIRWDGTGAEGAPAKEILGGRGPAFMLTPLREGLKWTYEWYQVKVTNLPQGQNHED